MITPADVEAIERATLNALPPLLLEEDDGWLLAANEGAVGRANSVLALCAGHDPLIEKLERAIAFYRRQGLPPCFRLSPWSQPAGLEAILSAQGFVPDQPTDVMIADLATALAALSGVEPAERMAAPDDAWRAVFLGAGFDAAEGAKRAATLARSQTSLFARQQVDAETVAIGALGVGGDWAGVHGMRTALAHRRRGLAARVLKALIEGAASQGVTRLFLQVEADNTPAKSLYGRLGFERAWGYAYWRPVG